MGKILAIPSGGNLYAQTVALLARLGIIIVVNGRNFMVDLLGSDIFNRAIIMRSQDMSEALAAGLVDAAIYGYDWHMENGLADQLFIMADLNYSKKTDGPVKVVVFSKEHEKLIDEPGISVSTEFLRLAAQVFKRATIRYSYGGTEQKVAYGKYDFGVCVMETGDSLRENGLVVVKEILTSPTILVSRQDDQEIRYFGELLVGGLRAAKLRLMKMNISQDSLSRALQLLPSLDAPTVNQLSNGDYAVESVVPADQVANLIIKLKGQGASGILSQVIEIVC